VFGTVTYMAPEQVAGRDMDHRSDQFSFGVMLYEMLTGVRPFDRGSHPETMAAILRDEVPPASAINPALSHEIDRILSRCLAKDPRDRYASTRDLARDLREIRDGLSHPSGRVTTDSRARPTIRSRIPVLLISALVVLIGIVAGVMWQRRVPVAAGITSIAVSPFDDRSESEDGRILADGISEMIATRLSEVRDLLVATPFGGVPIAPGEPVQDVAKRTGAQAVIRGSVARAGEGWQVSWALDDGLSGRRLVSGKVSRPGPTLLGLTQGVVGDLLRAMGRAIPGRATTAATMLGPDDEKKFMEANGLLQRVKDGKSLDRAIELLGSILRNTRDSAAVNSMMARALLHKYDLTQRAAFVEQASGYASRGVELSPDNAQSHVELGRLHVASGNHAAAIESFERALTLQENDPRAVRHLADALYRHGRAADADMMYRRALDLRPDAYGAHANYGAFCYELGRFEDAAKHFAQAAELMPTMAHLHSNLGAAYMALERHDDAFAAYRKAISVEQNAVAWSNLGTLQFQLGRYDDARASFEKSVALAPHDFRVWAHLGDARRWSPGMEAEAGEAYERALGGAKENLSITPNHAPTRATVASVLAKSGKTAEAMKEIERALRDDPNHSSVLYHAALVAVIRGNRDSASLWIERALAAGYPEAAIKRDPELISLGVTSLTPEPESANPP
jgi:tetratricopeptide (TPR) repeat protein/TolB-like protein